MARKKGRRKTKARKQTLAYRDYGTTKHHGKFGRYTNAQLKQMQARQARSRKAH